MSTSSSAEGAVIGILFTLVAVGFLIWLYRYLRGIGYVTLTVNNEGNYEADVDASSQLEMGNIHNPMFASESEKESEGGHKAEESTEQVMVDSITKSGYLCKLSSGISRDWQQRWFFVRNGHLYYCQKPSDLFGKQFIEAVCVANLLLSTVKEVSPNEFKIISPGQRKSGLHGGGEYSLYSEDPAAVDDWVKFIRQQIEYHLTQNSPVPASSSSAPGSEIFRELTPDKLTALRALNPICADCGVVNPDWSSLNLCIVICIECSGIHRSLGTHVTKVRSLTLDKWSPNCYQLLLDIGNNYSSCYWESDSARVAKEKPTNFSTRDEKEAFISNKYVKRVYVTSTGQSPDVALLSACVKGSLIEAYAALVRGANADAASGPDRALRSALHHAVSSKSQLLVELLCLWNADVSAVDAGGKTALKLATERNLKDIMSILQLYGAKI